MIWLFEDREVPVFVVRREHDPIDYGLVHDEFVDVNSAEMYGILRSRNVECVWLAAEEPVRICLDVIAEGVECQEWYVIHSEDYFRFIYEYIDTGEKSRVWVEEGFDWKKEGF